MVGMRHPGHRLGKIVFITEGAQGRRSQQKISPRRSRPQREPTRSQHANEVSARKKQHVSWNCTDSLTHTVCPLAYLRGRFSTWTAIPEELPVWALAKDLGRA